MNSEITSISKLVPMTVLKNKQNDQNVALDSSVPQEGLRTQATAPKEGAQVTSLESVKSAALKGNTLLQATNRNLEFKVDNSTHEVVVKIIDSKSGEVVRQIPTEEMLAFIKRLQDSGSHQGTLLKDKA